MPEINPYEAPQSVAESAEQAAATRKNKVPLLIKFFFGLQIVAGLAACFFWMLQAVAHNDIENSVIMPVFLASSL